MRLFDNFGGRGKRRISGILVMAMVAALGVTGCGDKEDTSSQESTETSQASESSGQKEFDMNSEETQKKTDMIEQYIDKYYYFDVDEDKREESYYDGLMKGLDDPYSIYYTKEEYDRLKEDDAGTFSGIGATLTQEQDTGYIRIVNTMKESPAEKAGLLKDDLITCVDGTDLTTDMDLDTIVSMIRGKKGTEVKLKVYRESEKEELEYAIVRDTIVTTSVEHQMLSSNIGYIAVSQFINTTAEEFKTAVDDLVNQGAEGLIIDMRSNPGGFVNSATTMADYLIDDGETAEGASKAGILLETKDKNGTVLDEIDCVDNHSVNLPMVVLVNGNTASASEIFTGIMRDYDKATVIGTKTYGKGIVQQVIPLDDGSAIKITIAKYFIPCGEDIHKEGLEPDKVVEYEAPATGTDAEDIEADNQVQAAMDELTK